MAHTYLVDLTATEQDALYRLIKPGKPSARKVARAPMRLQAAEGATDEDIAATLRVGLSTVHRPRQRFGDEGLTSALTERRRPGARPKWAGTQEAFFVALACSTPPAGRKRWTRQLLADRRVALQLVDMASDETGRRVLKKMTSSPGNAKNGVFPA